MGILNAQNNSNLILALTEHTIQLQGTHLQQLDSLQFINSTKKSSFLILRIKI